MAVLDQLDYDRSIIDKKSYEAELAELQFKILLAELRRRDRRQPVIIAFEGWDAAGKGGALLRLTQKLDPRGLSVWPIAAPSEEEKSHHYLWRFWRRLPEHGRWALFDRTWYGRVLVERVEGFAKKKEWRRAYEEIREFERQLTDDGATLIKIFLAVTKDEQLARFKEREQDPYKRWKITEEDWRNREKWDAYVAAAEEMFVETASDASPWTVIGANKKWYGRIEVLRTVLKRLEEDEKKNA